jgi:hypothetical protein
MFEKFEKWCQVLLCSSAYRKLVDLERRLTDAYGH